MKLKFFCILIIIFCFAAPVTARAAYLAPTHLDAVLVLDVSGSMNFADPDRLSYEAMMMFIDMLSIAGDRVGIVAYNDRIVASRELTLIQGQEDKDDLKDFIAGLTVGGFTDITLGLSEALRILDVGHELPNKPVIILFTDGNNHLSPGHPWTQYDLDRATEHIITHAKDRGYPIYTIGLNYDGTLNHAYIQRFSDETGALSFETTIAYNLPDILSAIFASQMDVTIIEIGEIEADGELHVFPVYIPDEMVLEANITFLSGQLIDVGLYDPLNRPVPLDGYWAVFSRASHYAVLKIISPTPGEWTLSVRGAAGDRIRINMLFSPLREPIEEEIQVPVLPIPSPTPAFTPTPEPEPEPEIEEPRDFTVLAYILAVVFTVVALVAIVIFVRKKHTRVFTGRLVMELTDHYTGEKSAPQYRNLIEYGRKTNLNTLLRGQGSSLLSAVILLPSPTAPSHLPQLIVKCSSAELKFKKDFMEQSAAQGIALSMRTELRIEIPSENKTLMIRYIE